MTRLPVYKASFPNNDWYSGILAISLVDEPAMESLFAKFSEESKVNYVSFNEEQRTVVGALIIPDKLIFRRNPETGEEFYVTYSKDVIKGMRDSMMLNGTHQVFNLHHDYGNLDNWRINATEVWIKDFEQDKSNQYGFDLPIGTLFVMAKINDDTIWSRVKEGELNGFSMECVMNYKYERMEQMYFSAVKVGFPVLKSNSDGNIENFCGKFSHEGNEVTTNENGIIVSIEPEKDKEPENNQEPVNNTEPEVTNNNDELVEKIATAVSASLTSALEPVLETFRTQASVFEQFKTQIETSKDISEKMALQVLASKQNQPEDNPEDKPKEVVKLSKLETINLLKQHKL